MSGGPKADQFDVTSVNCRIHFLKKTKAQTGKLVAVIPDGFVQLNASRGKETNFQGSYLFLISSQSNASISPRL